MMRSLGSGLVALAAVWGLAVGCGQSEGAGAGVDAGSSGTPTAAGASEAAGTAGNSGAGATAGTASGGSSAGGGASGGATGGQEAQAGAANEAGGSSSLVDCDPKKILCKRLAPLCHAGEVPSVVGNCYGECVAIDLCACSAAEQCPQPDQYTCWAKQHCGPFVE